MTDDPAPAEPTVFTPEMLRKNNYGLYIINVKAGNFEQIKKRPGYSATVAWKLGWAFEIAKNPKFWRNGVEYGGEEFKWAKYSKINILTDGWICPIGNSDEAVCEYLNNNPYGEKFRLMKKEEVVYLITNRNQGFYEQAV